jgi:cytochrome c-type biogenesis protein CcmH/NrfF
MSDPVNSDGGDGATPAPPAPPAPAQRSMPVAAIAGAIILIGLVGFALYRRAATTPAAPADAAAGTAQEGPGGTVITAQAPVHLTPEASILAERYRCVCGCNDSLSVCTCRNDRGSEEMKRFLQNQVNEGKSPEEIDAAMVAQFGPAALLKNPAPPQTLPSHAGAAKTAAP